MNCDDIQFHYSNFIRVKQKANGCHRLINEEILKQCFASLFEYHVFKWNLVSKETSTTETCFH